MRGGDEGQALEGLSLISPSSLISLVASADGSP